MLIGVKLLHSPSRPSKVESPSSATSLWISPLPHSVNTESFVQIMRNVCYLGLTPTQTPTQVWGNLPGTPGRCGRSSGCGRSGFLFAAGHGE